MDTACCTNNAKPSYYDLGTFQRQKLTRASIDVQTSASISLVTADGDKVTLNASSSLQASLLTYDYLGRSQGQTVAAHGKTLQLSANSGIAVSVEGSLDEEELNDIKKLLDTLSSVSKDFFAGNNQDSTQRMAQLTDLDSIASFEANFNYTKQITAVAVSQLSRPTPASAPEDPGSTTTAPTDNAPAAEPFIEQLARAAKRLDADDNLEKLPKRFAQLFKKLAQQLPLNDHDDQLARRIETEHSKRGRGHHNEDPAGAVS